MAEGRSNPPASTFVVRFWREWSAAGSRWRGQVEHVQSGQSATSPDLEGIVSFFQRHGVMDEGPPADGADPLGASEGCAGGERDG